MICNYIPPLWPWFSHEGKLFSDLEDRTWEGSRIADFKFHEGGSSSSSGTVGGLMVDIATWEVLWQGSLGIDLCQVSPGVGALTPADLLENSDWTVLFSFSKSLPSSKHLLLTVFQPHLRNVSHECTKQSSRLVRSVTHRFGSPDFTSFSGSPAKLLRSKPEASVRAKPYIENALPEEIRRAKGDNRGRTAISVSTFLPETVGSRPL